MEVCVYMTILCAIFYPQYLVTKKKDKGKKWAEVVVCLFFFNVASLEVEENIFIISVLMAWVSQNIYHHKIHDRRF